METTSEEQIFEQISRLLSNGLVTETTPVPEDTAQFDAIADRLRDLDRADIEGKLTVAGFVNHTVDGLRCFECSYYRVHRRWCALPEIDLPARPNWWCRLWRA